MNERISTFLTDRITAKDFPSAVYIVAEEGKVVFEDAIGNAVIEPEPIEAKIDTIYDLASLTKPLATTMVITRLVESGKVDPNEPIGNVLSEFYSSGNAEITVNDLMMHISGLPDWKPFYLLVDDADQIANEIAQTLGTFDQTPVTYSDLNFITLALLAERVTGSAFEDLTAALYSSLGLTQTSFNPDPATQRRIAASEKGNGYERQTCIDLGFDVTDRSSAFRDGIIWGEVHDGNAYFMGGIAGHAGLFSTASEVFKMALQFLPNYSAVFNAETCKLFRTDFTAGLNESRSFGFQMASTEGSTAGTIMSAESFGHNGFTGTSVWIDPEKERVFVLLTNRTHAHPLPFANINSTRREFHALAIDELERNK